MKPNNRIIDVTKLGKFIGFVPFAGAKRAADIARSAYENSTKGRAKAKVMELLRGSKASKGVGY